MQRLGEKNQRDEESHKWFKRGISVRDVQRVSDFLLKKMICWPAWKKFVLFGVLLASGFLWIPLLQLPFWEGKGRLLFCEIAAYVFLVSNLLFHLWVSTFPNWEMKTRRTITDRFIIITFGLTFALVLLGSFSHFEKR